MTNDQKSDRPDTSDMVAVHKVFRSAFGATPAYVESAVGDDERRALLADYYANVLDFLDVHHDGEEELVFPLLIERAPEHAGAVQTAIEQHKRAVEVLESAKIALADWQKRGDQAGPAMVSACKELDEVLSAHLDEEEATILPLATEHLTVEEWGMLPGHGMSRFRGDKIWLIMGLIRENFTPEQRSAMLEGMPPPARQMWETMGESSFNQMIAEVRQTA